FMPESLARVEPLDFLSADEMRTLNQIRGAAYLGIFGLVEEFILPFVLDHARPQLQGDDYRVRALLQFAGEEAKHILLFKRFREEFKRGFGHDCAVIGPPEAIAQAVLAHDPLAVALTVLHIEWMTQRHYLDSVKTTSRSTRNSRACSNITGWKRRSTPSSTRSWSRRWPKGAAPARSKRRSKSTSKLAGLSTRGLSGRSISTLMPSRGRPDAS